MALTCWDVLFRDTSSPPPFTQKKSGSESENFLWCLNLFISFAYSFIFFVFAFAFAGCERALTCWDCSQQGHEFAVRRRRRVCALDRGRRRNVLQRDRKSRLRQQGQRRSETTATLVSTSLKIIVWWGVRLWLNRDQNGPGCYVKPSPSHCSLCGTGTCSYTMALYQSKSRSHISCV